MHPMFTPNNHYNSLCKDGDKNASGGIRRSIFVAMILTGAIATAVLAQNGGLFKARDPGPRPNPNSPIPNPVAGLNDNETALFNESLLRVSELRRRRRLSLLLRQQLSARHRYEESRQNKRSNLLE